MKLIQTTFTKRALMAGLIAASGIVAASSFAMPDGGAASKAACEARHGENVHANWEQRRAMRLSALKEKLKLRPEQAAAWDAFAQASQPGMRRINADRQAMRGEFTKLNTPQRLDRMLAMSDTRRARMLERSQAIKSFYAQLSPEQQSVFDAEAMPDRRPGHERHRLNPM